MTGPGTAKTGLGIARAAVTAEEDGRRYLYRPAVAREDYVAGESQRLIDRLFGGKLTPLVAHLAERDKLDADDIAEMNEDAVVFAMANPVPEVDPVEAGKHATVVATGRSDFANQINNVLAFPGVFRGLLDAHATKVSDRMLLAAAKALADVVSADELNPTYIVPSVFHDGVTKAVASAVEEVAREEAGTVDTITGAMRPVYADEIVLER